MSALVINSEVFMYPDGRLDTKNASGYTGLSCIQGDGGQILVLKWQSKTGKKLGLKLSKRKK